MNRSALPLLLYFAACLSCSNATGDAPRSPHGVKNAESAPAEQQAILRSRGADAPDPLMPPASPAASKEVPDPVPQAETKIESVVASPFRLVLDGSSGTLMRHQGHKIYSGQEGIFDITTGESLASCSFADGYLLQGKSLFFAARMSPYSACPDEPYLLEQVGKKWQLRKFIDAHDLKIDEWVSGTNIAAVVPYRAGPPWGYELVRVGGGRLPPQPQRGASHPPISDQKCYSELQRPQRLH
ncbi:MAG: hypothetical protein MK135_10140, partial [Polyangiaceae bacterium]|nr:hypothetical protein [Polyangiaceae bacterium]